MQNTIKTYFISAFIFILANSCAKTEITGLWDDIIKLSQKEVEVPAEKNSVLITTQGEWWWISDITFNDTLIDKGNIDTTQDNFIIEHPEFSIERRNKTEIYIRMNENTSESPRILNIWLEAGDYFDSIKITQQAK